MPNFRPVFIGAILMLAGCAAQQGVTLSENSDWNARKRALEQTDEWNFAGRIGVSAGREGFNGKLWWRQDGIVFRARISGPLGFGTVFINGDRRELTLTDRDGVVTEMDDAEVDLRRRYGWTIPVSSLRFWVLGIADPASDATETFNDEGLLEKLVQQEWQVEFLQYAPGGGRVMPRRLTAVNDDIKVRLVIDDWTFR